MLELIMISVKIRSEPGRKRKGVEEMGNEKKEGEGKGSVDIGM